MDLFLCSEKKMTGMLELGISSSAWRKGIAISSYRFYRNEQEDLIGNIDRFLRSPNKPNKEVLKTK